MTNMDDVYRQMYERHQQRQRERYAPTEPKEISPEYREYLDKLAEDPTKKPSPEWCLYQISQKLDRRAIGGKFKPTEKQRRLMNYLWQYFRGEGDVLDTSKGILLSGSFGCGKTEILRAFTSTPFGAYEPGETITKMASAIEMIDHFNQAGNFDGYFGRPLFIDDLGTEQRAKYMTKDAEPVLSKFIELWHLRSTSPLFISTNLEVLELREKYGGRVYSRLHQLCNIVTLDERDFRL